MVEKDDLVKGADSSVGDADVSGAGTGSRAKNDPGRHQREPNGAKKVDADQKESAQACECETRA